MNLHAFSKWLPAVLGVCLLTAVASAGFNYDENVDGSLSNDGLNPTVLVPGPGNNYVAGSLDGFTNDPSDFFTFAVPSGWTFGHLCVCAYTFELDTSFMGIEDDNIYVTGQQNENYFGYTFFGTEDIDQDILPVLGASNGNFTPPLGPGDYTFWLNEGTHPRDYVLRFVFIYPGDMNCDGVVDFGDINPFVAAMTSAEEYQTLYPECTIENGDVNGDGEVDFGDINSFVALLAGK